MSSLRICSRLALAARCLPLRRAAFAGSYQRDRSRHRGHARAGTRASAVRAAGLWRRTDPRHRGADRSRSTMPGQPDGDAPSRSGDFTVSEGAGMVTLRPPKPPPKSRLADGDVTFRNAAGEADPDRERARQLPPAHGEGRPIWLVAPAVQPRHRRGLLRPRPAPEPADELQWRGRRARPAQYGRRRSRSSSRPAITVCCGTIIRSPASAIRRPMRFAGGEADGLNVIGADGKPGWTANYYLGEQLAVTAAASR